MARSFGRSTRTEKKALLLVLYALWMYYAKSLGEQAASTFIEGLSVTEYVEVLADECAACS